MSLFMNLFLYKFLCRGIQALIWFVVLSTIGLTTMTPIGYVFLYAVIFYILDSIFDKPVLTYERIPQNSDKKEEEEENE